MSQKIKPRKSPRYIFLEEAYEDVKKGMTAIAFNKKYANDPSFDRDDFLMLTNFMAPKHGQRINR